MTDEDRHGVGVLAGEDRFGRRRAAFGALTYTIKVASSDTAGALLVIEQGNARPGGPPRHLHHAQEEWFYVLAGSYDVEVGDVLRRLGPGDAVLAPRGVAHGWARTGDGPGRLLIAFQPAGTMEAFLAASEAFAGVPAPGEAAALFAAHGMQVVGPPLGAG